MIVHLVILPTVGAMQHTNVCPTLLPPLAAVLAFVRRSCHEDINRFRDSHSLPYCCDTWYGFLG